MPKDSAYGLANANLTLVRLEIGLQMRTSRDTSRGKGSDVKINRYYQT